MTKFQKIYQCGACLNNTTEEDDLELQKRFRAGNYFGSPFAGMDESDEIPKLTRTDRKNMDKNCKKIGITRTHQQVKNSMFERTQGVRDEAFERRESNAR